MPVRIERVEVRLKRPLIDIPEVEFKRGLARPPSFPWLPAEIASEKLLPSIQSEAPVDGEEVVSWMQLSAAEAGILDALVEDYNRLGSQLISDSGDPYIPGVRCGDLRVPSVLGSTVLDRGYGTVVTPRGSFNCPVGGKATGIFSDILAWARLTWAGAIQWCLSLLQWKDLASTPVSQRVRFPSLDRAVGPLFFRVRTTIPVPVAMMSIGLTSNASQTMSFWMRSDADYTSVLSSGTFDLPAGESAIDYVIFGFPFVEPFVLHLQPGDNTETVLDSLTVTPP